MIHVARTIEPTVISFRDGCSNPRAGLISPRSKMPSNCAICCEILIAILLPPVGVCLRHGCCTVEFFICLILTCLGYLPGIIYAIYAIVFIDRDEYFDDYRRPIYYVA